MSGLIIADYYNLTPLIDIDNSSIHSEKEKTIVSQLFSKYIRINIKNSCNKLEVQNISSITNYKLIKEGDVDNIDDGDKCIDGIYSLIPKGMSDTDYIQKKIHLYKSLSYPDFLLNDINKFNNTYDLNKCIGIHIRYTDNFNDTGKVQLNTKLETFIHKINTYNNQTILLCSDNKDVLKNTEIHNSNNTIILANTCSDSMYQALYEMMLLSNTKLIIGSSSSTFSYESAFMKGTDIELFENNQWVRYELSKFIYMS
jgi:hypothetical protein